MAEVGQKSSRFGIGRPGRSNPILTLAKRLDFRQLVDDLFAAM